MSERKNVQTEHKWVGHIDSPGGPYYAREDPGDTIHVEHATLFDSPSDVPDDCTPVRVRVETWEEEGEPERIKHPEEADGFQLVSMYTGEVAHKGSVFSRSEVTRKRQGGDIPHSFTAIPVRIPTETKRKVTLDPEPTETGCRCRGKVERAMAGMDPVFGDPVIPVDYEEGIRDMKRVVLRALADCDCKS